MQTYTPLDYESSIPSFDTSWCELNNDLIVFSIMGRASEEHLNFHLTSVHGGYWSLYMIEQLVQHDIDRWIRLLEVG